MDSVAVGSAGSGRSQKFLILKHLGGVGHKHWDSSLGRTK
ncbi:hypothetical protein VB005_07622 [Metarhizium brunneum]